MNISKLGRILVVFVFVMSSFFLAFAFMVFMSRTDWNAKVAQAQSDLQSQQGVNREIRDQIRRLEIDRTSGKAASSNALALLEANVATSEMEIAKTRQTLTSLQQAKQEKGNEVTGTLATLQAERVRVDEARSSVNTVQAQRDRLYTEVLQLKNQILELEAVRQRLNATEERMMTY